MDYLGVPYHRGNREDAQPLEPGVPARMHFDLLPTSMIVKAGMRLRVSFAGADPRQRFRTVVFDPPPAIRLHHLDGASSRLSLPVAGDLRFVQPGS